MGSGLVQGGVGTCTVRRATMQGRMQEFDGFLIDRPEDLPAEVADELISGGTLPLMLDAMEYATVSSDELLNLRVHTLHGDALLVLLNESGEVVALFLQQMVNGEVMYLSAAVVSPKRQGQGLLRLGCSALVCSYRPEWLVTRTQQAVIARYASTLGQLHPMSGQIPAEARSVAQLTRKFI